MDTSSSMVVEPPKTDAPTPAAPAMDKPKVLEVPINPDGSIGKLPDDLQRFMDDRIRKRIGEIKEKTTLDPVEKERLRQLEEENQRFKIEDAEKAKRYDEALDLRTKSFHEEKQTLQAQIDRRNAKLQEMIGAEIRGTASALGARKEALEDIAEILRKRVAMDDDLNPIVLDTDGKPVDGITIEQLVAQTLEAKPYFKNAQQPGGGARGGASMSGMVAGVAAAEQKALADAEHAWKTNPSDKNLAAVFRAQENLKRAMAAAQKR